MTAGSRHSDSRDCASSAAFLAGLNHALAGFEDTLYSKLQSAPPCVFVVGLPRSGTTLLIQVISSALRVGYISNLIARFWRAPVTGIRLAVAIEGDFRPSGFESVYGRTQGVHDPNEFGYFWRCLLGCEGLEEPSEDQDTEVDWSRVRLVLDNMTDAFAAPLVLKGFIAQWHLPDLAAALPNSLFIRMRRNPVDSAASLVGMRERLFGSREAWASLRPRQCKHLGNRPYWEQVAGQVFYIEQSLDAGMSMINPERIMEVELEALLANPAAIASRVREFLSRHGQSVERTNHRDLPPFESDGKRSETADYARIKRSYREFAAGNVRLPP